MTGRESYWQRKKREQAAWKEEQSRRRVRGRGFKEWSDTGIPPTPDGALTIARRAIEDVALSPSTVRLVNPVVRQVEVRPSERSYLLPGDLGNTRYQVATDIDAQNLAGAVLRQSVTVDCAYHDERGMWQVRVATHDRRR
jgi:hypothetical protein